MAKKQQDWQPEDEVVTTFGTLKRAQEESFEDGRVYERNRLFEQLKAAGSSGDYFELSMSTLHRIFTQES